MNWPIVMYMGLVVAAPYLMWKLVASVAGLEGDGGGGEGDGRETERFKNEASYCTISLNLICKIVSKRLRELFRM